MIIFSILFLILSNAVTLRWDKFILYSRVVILVLLYSSEDEWFFFIGSVIILLLLIFLHPTFIHNYHLLYRYILIISLSLLILIILYFLMQYYWNGLVFTGRGGGSSSASQGAGTHRGPVNPAPEGPNRMSIGNILQGDNGDTVFTHDGEDTSVNFILGKLRTQHRYNLRTVNHKVSWVGYPNDNTLNRGDIALVKAKIAADNNTLKKWVVLPSGTLNPVEQVKVITDASRSTGNYSEASASLKFINYFGHFKYIYMFYIFIYLF